MLHNKKNSRIHHNLVKVVINYNNGFYEVIFMYRNKTPNRKKIMIIFTVIFLVVIILIGRLVYLMIFCSEYYGQKADSLHERERDIKAARGNIYDTNGVLLASNKTVCTVSVIHSQIKDPAKITEVLSKELNLPPEDISKKVAKVSSIERIKTNVDKSTGDAIREYGLAGVKVDEDYKRFYPYSTLASKVLGFTGGDNQGIIGLEVGYDKYLQGKPGKILTLTDARGVEIANAGETRQEPIDGDDLYISLDYNIQTYAEQAAKKVMQEKQAESVSVIIMNPQNGEVKAMVNVPEFDLNNPYQLNYDLPTPVDDKEKQNLLNQMWRNPSINDTYEPGSTFKIITASAALEQGVVKLSDTFYCPGYKIVEDRRIRCSKTTGHGSEDFTQGIMNSCKQV
jgi:stage V sporulation protein D (sporulation-specific penicillin-binding protein)